MKITCHVFASVFFLLSGLHQSQAAIVSWVGGSGDWNTATNWSSGVVPRSTNDVVIDRPGELTITHSSGSHTVRSIQCQESFLLSGGLLSVTNGSSSASGEFRVSGGAVLAVAGPATSFSAPNATNIDGGGLSVSGGAVLSLPEIRSYRKFNTECNATWLATGAGSVIDLPGLTNLTGFQCSILGGVGIQALAGGRILLTNLTTIPDGRVGVLADGTNSLVDLSRLNDYQQTNLVLTLEARSGGSILVPNFVDGGQVALVLKPGGSISTAQFRKLLGVTLESGVTLTLPGVTNIDGANFTVSGGAMLSLPGVSRYRQNSTECGATWLASGEGSIIDLPGLTNLTGFNCSILGGVSIQALAGAHVLLTNLAVIPDGPVSVLADGFNSLVDLSAMTGHPGVNFSLSLEARNGGSICVPRLVDGNHVTLTLKAGGFISTTQFRRLYGVTLESGVTLTLPAVTNINGGGLNVMSLVSACNGFVVTRSAQLPEDGD